MVMKNPISLMTTPEMALDVAPIMTPNVRDVMSAVPKVSQVETSTVLLVAQKEVRWKQRAPAGPEMKAALDA